nr:MAG TPA: hypothetical protein [Caudoviricetes sp.]DAX71148.1 MAG TPA: hypothetical protein [Caudoviricetes sp.]
MSSEIRKFCFTEHRFFAILILLGGIDDGKQ